MRSSPACLGFNMADGPIRRTLHLVQHAAPPLSQLSMFARPSATCSTLSCTPSPSLGDQSFPGAETLCQDEQTRARWLGGRDTRGRLTSHEMDGLECAAREAHSWPGEVGRAVLDRAGHVWSDLDASRGGGSARFLYEYEARYGPRVSYGPRISTKGRTGGCAGGTIVLGREPARHISLRKPGELGSQNLVHPSADLVSVALGHASLGKLW